MRVAHRSVSCRPVIRKSRNASSALGALSTVLRSRFPGVCVQNTPPGNGSSPLSSHPETMNASTRPTASISEGSSTIRERHRDQDPPRCRRSTCGPPFRTAGQRRTHIRAARSRHPNTSRGPVHVAAKSVTNSFEISARSHPRDHLGERPQVCVRLAGRRRCLAIEPAVIPGGEGGPDPLERARTPPPRPLAMFPGFSDPLRTGHGTDLAPRTRSAPRACWWAARDSNPEPAD